VVTDPQTNTQTDIGDYNTLCCRLACNVIIIRVGPTVAFISVNPYLNSNS